MLFFNMLHTTSVRIRKYVCAYSTCNIVHNKVLRHTKITKGWIQNKNVIKIYKKKLVSIPWPTKLKITYTFIHTNVVCICTYKQKYPKITSCICCFAWPYTRKKCLAKPCISYDEELCIIIDRSLLYTFNSFSTENK